MRPKPRVIFGEAGRAWVSAFMTGSQTTPSLPTPLWRPQEAAQYLGIYEKTVIKLARLHKLPALRLGKHWRFRRTDLVSWVATQVQSICRVAGDTMPATTPTPLPLPGRLFGPSPPCKGPDVWVYRWRETDEEGQRVQRNRVVGTVSQLSHHVRSKASRRGSPRRGSMRRRRTSAR